MGDAKVAQLHLRLRPRQRGRARKSRCITVAIHQIKQCFGRRGNHGPECDPRDPAWWHADAAADRKDRVKHRARRA